jgi:hypothetical protein
MPYLPRLIIMDRVGVERTTCGSEESDSTTSIAFHDWLPSQGKTKAIINETITHIKIFMNSCSQKQGEC